MKICFFTHTFPKDINDSTAAFLHPLVLGIKKAGGDVVVVTPYSQGMKPETFPYKVETYKYIWPKFLHRLGYSTTLGEGKRLPIEAYLIIPFLFVFGIWKLISVCRKEKIDIICSHWILPNGFMAFLSSKLLNISYTVTLPGSDVYVAGKNVFFKYFAVTSAEKASFVISDSPIFLDRMVKLGAKIKRSQIIPYPVDVGKYKKSAEGIGDFLNILGLSKNNILILAVGRLVEKKGFEFLIRSMSEITKKNKQVRLVVVGEGDLKNKLTLLTKKLGINEFVKFVGNVNRKDIFYYYNMSDIFVMPSIRDAMGNVDDQPVALLEAMASSLPVIATDLPGIAMNVKNDVNGFLVPQKGIKEIETALLKLIYSKDLRQKMGKESRRLAVANISVRIIGSAYMSIFKEVLNSRYG